jgi:hypothetical protein
MKKVMTAIVIGLILTGTGCRSGRVSMRTFSVLNEGKPQVIMELQYEEVLGPGFGRQISTQPRY